MSASAGNSAQVKRKKSKAAGDRLSGFIVDVAIGDMPTETVIRADKVKNPAADALRRMGKIKGKRLALRSQRSGAAKSGAVRGSSRRAGSGNGAGEDYFRFACQPWLAREKLRKKSPA